MKDLQYTQAAGFSEVDTPVDLAWSDQDDDETARAQRLGWEPYYATSDYCDSTWESITVWLTGNAQWTAVAHLNLGDRWEVIWFPTRADLAHYWHQFASSRIAQHNDLVHQIHETIAKAFHAWHGHDQAEICRQCSPRQWHKREWDRRMERERAAALVVIDD